MAIEMQKTGFQMLNDTSVQAESDPVDDETDEDEDNNSESSKGPFKCWHVFCVRDSYGVVRTTIGCDYTRAFGDGPRNFEPWSSDVNDTLAGTSSPNYYTTPTGGRFSS
ncbi:hypothetical protein TNCV_1587751 [Trichonephila clavipes]|uniref:Uncharacterized protein n=1 Tax=Trichonephila clavipes TaxID=2585209 RepID=A0A8X6UZH4_TRICX|nr:hypothetical protein TNCV_1587751 [Trichonephila clavipes]